MKARAFVSCTVGAILVLGSGFAVATPQQRKADESKVNNPVKAPSEDDKAFMKGAAIGNAAEIGLGQMAQAKSSNPQVKQFGERMVKDHSKADDQLKALAASQHVSLPTELDPPHKAAKAQVSKLTGDQFDKAYMRLMVHEHTSTINEFKREASVSQDPTLKNFAASTLAVLESHLAQARQINGKVNGKQ